MEVWNIEILLILLIKQTECDHTYKVRFKRIPSERSPNYNNWNFMVYLSIAVEIDDFSGVKQCIATMINEKWILSAAHCFNYDMPNNEATTDAEHRKLTIYVVAGKRDILYGQNSPVTAQAMCHKGHSFGSITHDICVLRLSEAMDFHRHNMRQVNLPKTHDQIIPGSTCKIAGWGSSSINQERKANSIGKLWDTELFLEDNNVCQYIFKSVYQAAYNKSTLICTSLIPISENGHMPYKGDSGCPLICNGRQYGILSFGPTKSSLLLLPQQYTYVAYTNVQFYLDWIYEVVVKNNLTLVNLQGDIINSGHKSLSNWVIICFLFLFCR